MNTIRALICLCYLFCVFSLSGCKSIYDRTIVAETFKPELEHAQCESKINIINVVAESHSIVVSYEISGKEYKEYVTCGGYIYDFRYCRWKGNNGIAIVASTGGGWMAQRFYSAFTLSTHPSGHHAINIEGASVGSYFLSIASTQSDALIITGTRTEPFSGWIYTDFNPRTDTDLPEENRGRIFYISDP